MAPKDPNALRLRDLVQPPPPVELPSGHQVPCKPFTYRMHELARDIFATPEGAEQDRKLRELVGLCIPDAGDELDDLTAEDMLAIVAHAQRRLDSVLGFLESRRPKPNEGDEGNAQAPAGRKGKSRRRSG